VIKDNPPPNWDNWENAKVKCNKKKIINISEIRIYLWRVVEQIAGQRISHAVI
jgi:hypothetical protein